MNPTRSENVRGQSSDIVWVGEPQNSDVYPKHYRAFVKDGTQINVHSFVLLLPVVGPHYIGYIEELYEKENGSKEAKVRWLHRHSELKNLIPVSDKTSDEIYLSRDTKSINVETIDVIATVLTEEHYKRCLNEESLLKPLSVIGIYMCRTEVVRRSINLFDLSRLPGYSNQNIFSFFPSLSSPLPCGNRGNRSSDLPCGNPSTQFPRRPRTDKNLNIVPSGDSEVQTGNPDASCPASRNVQIGNPVASCSNTGFKILENNQMQIHSVGREHDGSVPLDVLYEVLSPQFPGRWLKCKLLWKTSTLMKVRYHDSEAGGRLEEDLPYGVAPPDRLGMRLAGRMVLRPSPPLDSTKKSFQLGEQGLSVDVWLNKSWCEGVFISPGDISTPDQYVVYLLGENILKSFNIKDIRVSKDWVEEKWMQIPRKWNILPTISAML